MVARQLLKSRDPSLQLVMPLDSPMERAPQHRAVVFIPVFPWDDVTLISTYSTGAPLFIPSSRLLPLLLKFVDQSDAKPWPLLPAGVALSDAARYWVERSVRSHLHLRAFDSLAGLCALLQGPLEDTRQYEDLRIIRHEQLQDFGAVLARLTTTLVEKKILNAAKVKRFGGQFSMLWFCRRPSLVVSNSR